MPLRTSTRKTWVANRSRYWVDGVLVSDSSSGSFAESTEFVSTSSSPGSWPIAKRTPGALHSGRMEVIVQELDYTPAFHGMSFQWYYPGYPSRAEYDEREGLIRSDGVNWGTLPPYADTSKVSDEAVVKLVAQAKDTRTKFQSGVFLGELKETLGYIRQTARKADNTFRTLDQQVPRVVGRFRQIASSRGGVKAANRYLGQKWLEWQFAIKPVLNDARSLAEAISHLRNSGSDHVVAVPLRAKAHVEVKQPGVWTEVISGPAKYEVCSTDLQAFTVKLFAFAKTYANGVGMYRNVLGFQPEDFIPTVWELLPYSWMADYFTNIGDVVNTWSWISGSFNGDIQRTTVNRSRSERTHFRSVTAQYLPTAGTALTLNRETFSPGFLAREWRHISREVIQPLDLLPSVRFQLPNPGQWANIAAFWAARSGHWQRILRL